MLKQDLYVRDGNLVSLLTPCSMPFFVMPSSDTRAFIEDEPGNFGKEILRSDAIKYIEGYENRLEKFKALHPDIIKPDLEPKGWRFDLDIVIGILDKLRKTESAAPKKEIIILFGVDPNDHQTHLIITTPTGLKKITEETSIPQRQSNSSADNDDVVGAQHGTSCCAGISIKDCVQVEFSS